MKRARQSAKRRLSNKSARSLISSLRRQINDAIAQGNISLCKELLPKICSALDKAAKTGKIKANAASRRKSRLTSRIAAIEKA
jgi:small subunit ribosomal protein S20